MFLKISKILINSSYLFPNFFLPHPAIPNNLVPRKSIVEGSGTGDEIPSRTAHE